MTARKGLVATMPVLAAMAMALTAATRPMTSERDIAVAWAKENSPTLPTRLATVASFTVNYRKAILHQLPLAQQKAIWREQLETFLLPTDKLTALQRKMVAELPAPLTEKQRGSIIMALGYLDRVFDPAISDDARTALAARLCVALTSAFPAGSTAKSTIFTRIGPSDADSSAPKASLMHAGLDLGLARLIRHAAEKAGIISTYRPDCNCGYSVCDCTGIGMYCLGEGDCDPSSWGCGCLGWTGCSGTGCKAVE